MAGTATRELQVKFVGTADPSVDRAANQTQKAMQGMADAAESSGGRSATALGILQGVAGGIAAKLVDIAGSAVQAAGAFISSSVSMASDLNETLSKSEAIFGDQAGAMEAWASTSDKAYGLSKAAALDAAAGFGDMFLQLGFVGDQAAGMSQDIVGLAADLGSFNNLDTSEVLDMLSASFRGEYDSLQRVIPNINAARVETEALAQTGKSSAKELTAQEKATATLSIVQGDASRAAGDFAKTSDGAANMQKILSARVDNLKGKLGQGLLPILTGVLGFVTDRVMPGLENLADKFAPVFDGLDSGIGEAKTALADGWTFGADSGELEPTNNPVIRVLREIGGVAADAQGGFTEFGNGVKGTFTDISPDASTFQQFMFGLGSGIRENVIPAWGDLQGSFQQFSEKTKPVVDDVVEFIKSKWHETGPAASEDAEKLTEVWGSALEFMSALVERVGDAISWFWDEHGEQIKLSTSAAWDGITATIGGALDVLKGIINTGTAILNGDWGTAWDNMLGTTNSFNQMCLDAASGLVNAIAGLFGVDNLTGKITAGFQSAMSWINNTFIGGVNSVLSTVGIDWSIPTIPGFAAGGYTGAGGMYDPAGVVHRGEVVWSQRDVAAWGGPGQVDAMRRWRGYAEGGIVGTLTSAASTVIDLITDPGAVMKRLIDGLLAESPIGGLAGAFVRGLSGIAPAIADAIKDKLGSLLGAGSYEVGAGATQWESVAIQAMNAAGLSLSYLPLLLHRIQVESGGNPNAINNWDSNAAAGMPSQGLMQTIPGTFAAYAGPYADRGITDPFANIYAAIKYTLARYGLAGIEGAWGGSMGYDSGGMLQPGLSLVANKTNRPEPVLTGDQWDNLMDRLTKLIVVLEAMTGRPVLDEQELAVLLAGVGARRGEPVL